jgi:hypothetical protein
MIERGYCIEEGCRVPETAVTFSASHDVCGGGTGNEYVENLAKTGTQPWNKWYTGYGNSASVTQYIQRGAEPEYYISKYAFCTANDCDIRDPVSWTLTGSK